MKKKNDDTSRLSVSTYLEAIKLLGQTGPLHVRRCGTAEWPKLLPTATRRMKEPNKLNDTFV